MPMDTTLEYNNVTIHVFGLGRKGYLYIAEGQDFETLEDAKGYIDMQQAIGFGEDLQDVYAKMAKENDDG